MTFSGHDTFHCRLFWLKKGFDYVSTGHKFKDDSGVDLGVGRNMVNSIRFWMKAFGILNDEYQISSVFHKILNKDGWDPYFENEGTLWLLHYELCATNYSTIYQILFREFRKVKPEFTRENFVKYVQSIDNTQNTKILEKDFSVFLRMYGNFKDKNIEDGYTGLLTELNLVKKIGKTQNDIQLYRIENNYQQEVPQEILLYCLLTNTNYGDSISFKSLYQDDAGIGNIFCFDQDILENKLQEIAANNSFITYSSEAGVKELQFKKKPNPITVLQNYYNA
jgi:hypothetical protein|tara:strand:+ start:89354 stop:90190 length:837 start_codon:yes stop_codon:yes gene_type:complete